MKNLGKVAVSIVKSPENFHGTHIWGALRGHLCGSTAFLLFMLIILFLRLAVPPGTTHQ